MPDDAPKPRNLAVCALCEHATLEHQLLTFAIAKTPTGLVNFEIHLACFIQTIAGEVSREVVAVLESGKEPGGFLRERGEPLDRELERLVYRLIQENL